MHLYNGLNSTNKLSAWEEMNHLCYGWDGVDGVLISENYLILQVNKAHSK